MTTLVACLVPTACVGGGSGSDGDRSSTPANPSPGGGGRVEFGVIGEPATLDPYAPVASDLTYALVRPLYRSLYRSLPDGDPEPDLVEELRSIPGGVRIRLEEATWSDGRRITASDVARTVRRAREPSGLAGLMPRVRDRSTIELLGDEEAWKQRLARVTYVLPRGRARPGIYSGPLRLTARTPGLQLVYRPNPRWDSGVLLRRLRVRSVATTGTLLNLLEDGDLDAAVVPSTVNLDERLELRGIPFQRALGWESVWLDISSLDEGTRRTVAGLDRAELEEGFVRAGGRLSNTLRPGPGSRGAEGPFRAPERGRAAVFSLAVPAGDELLDSAQRAVQLQLAQTGLRVDLVTIDVRRFYGPWRIDAPVDAFMLRSSGAPGLPEEVAAVRSFAAIPLFHVATYLVGGGVDGLEVNPTLEGPLWNVEEWARRKAR